MKTDTVRTTDVKHAGKSIEERKPLVQGARRCLQPLQAATDKENLVAGGRLDMPPHKDISNFQLSKSSELTPSKRQKSGKNVEEKRRITVEDLTSEGPPSIAYYEALCDKQREALEEALKENEVLHKRVSKLKEENNQMKIVLEETKTLVETLTEIINAEGYEDEAE